MALHGAPAPPRLRTIASEMETFLNDIQAEQGLSGNTITSYRCDLRTAAGVVDKPLETITTLDIQSFLDSRNEQPGTTNRRIASLGRFFRWAVARGYCLYNPLEQIAGRYHTEHRPQPIVSEAERRALDIAIAACSQPYRLIFTLLREIGVRTDEVLNLNVGDVILEAGREVLLVQDTKSGNKRMVALTPDAMPRSLRGLRSWMRDLGPSPASDAPLFCSSRGKRASYDTLHRRWVQVCRAAHLIDVVEGKEQPRYTLHHLRHTAAAELIAFYPEQVVRRILGHRDPRSTRRYADIVRKGAANPAPANNLPAQRREQQAS
ncbi:tyrosine-type recombinase/integrase [Candidatus Oscillochloris fontis]|uniref:tyrosine-type recombinase/integrase n=1 Tax=Candidatus Oscillochloris fontis TaxID=2496868 RepID=UPI001EE8B8E7|nr:tyrosine-type recombinase/integrase [Candidatus Oscillochloris fontis]